MRLPATLLCATLLLAGCAQPSSTNGDAADPGDPATPSPVEALHATIVIDRGELQEEEPVQAVVTFDPDSRPSMHLYNDTGTPRPDAYTVHDLLLDWSTESGVPVTVEYHAALGYSVTSIDGVTAHSTQGGRWHWGLFIDDERNTQGIGSIPVEDDAEYEWRFMHTSS